MYCKVDQSVFTGFVCPLLICGVRICLFGWIFVEFYVNVGKTIIYFSVVLGC